jgi:hypothetical protein
MLGDKKMDLIDFRNYVKAEREATRQLNLTAILSVANATIQELNERKTENE